MPILLPDADTPPADRLITLPRGVPKLTLGWEAMEWAMLRIRQPNGPMAGKLWSPIESQVRFLLWWYAVDEDGRWLYHHAVRRLAKGSGKSPFAAVLALMEFLGPVRLKDFNPIAPGGCIGKPVDMPLVQIAATAESQTANTMRMVRAMAQKGSALALEYGLDVGKTKYYKSPEGTLEIITSSAGAAEGAESTFNVWDETEHWLPGQGGPALAETLGDNLTKSGSRALETCNAWVPGVDSVAEISYSGWLAQEEGKTKGSSKILYDARIASPDCDMENLESLKENLQHVYDDCFWVDLVPIIEKIWDPRSELDASKRKYMNWPTVAQDAWCDPNEWKMLRNPDRVVDFGEDICMFFDGSKSRDATALVGCCVSDGHVFTIAAWEPKTDTHADEEHRDIVSVAEVDAAVDRAFREYNPVGFFADVQEWESFVKVSWPERYADRLQIHATPVGRDPHPIAWDMRTKVMDFTMAAELALTEIKQRQDGKPVFTHDGDARMTRHVGNARNRPNRWGVSIGKESPSSPRKVDLAVCMIGARMVRRLYISGEGRKKKLTGKVWGC